MKSIHLFCLLLIILTGCKQPKVVKDPFDPEAPWIVKGDLTNIMFQLAERYNYCASFNYDAAEIGNEVYTFEFKNNTEVSKVISAISQASNTIITIKPSYKDWEYLTSTFYVDKN